MEDGTFVQKVRKIASKRSFLIFISILYLISFFLTSLFTDRWGYYQLLFSFNFIFYLLLIYSISNSDLLEKRYTIITLFLVPLTLQLLLLFRDPSFSQDIMRLQFRGEAMADGLIPYEDFEINKPPLYIWMVGFISKTLGTSQLTFRTVFIIFNSLIPVIMYSINDTRWKMGAAAYALWPVALMETGVAGHFDPVVAFLVLLSFLYLKKDAPLLSGILLGAGFALKMFPLFITPFFFLSLGNYRKRTLFFIGFFIIPLLSSLPFLISNPSALSDYILYQSSGWGSSMSYRYLLDLAGMPGTFLIATLILASGILLLMIMGLKRIATRGFILASLIILTLVPTGYFSVILLVGATGSWILIGSIPVAISLILIAIAFKQLPEKGDHITNPDINWLKETIPMERVPELSALALILLLVTSAQFHPWYLVWTAPFAFSSGSIRSFILITGPLHFNAYPPWDMGGFF